MKGCAVKMLLISTILLVSCAYNKFDPDRAAVNCLPADSVSFSKHIIPILNKNCSTSGCHTGFNPEGNLNLDASVAYASLTNPRKGYTDTSNPKFSVLYSSLISESDPMPPNGRMDYCEIDQIVSWMKKGAKND